MAERIAWVDASAGVAGDMMLGALLDAGADLAVVQQAVDAVVPDAVRIEIRPVHRAGARAARALVEVRVEDPPHRTWSTIRDLLEAADLPDRVRARATATFAGLAAAEGRVHGVPAEEIHFHEVGALDSLADVIGVCAALEDLGVDRLLAGEVAVGSGRARMAHGDVGIPVPAVVELARGWTVRSGGRGELTTPTGMALLAALAEPADLPVLRVDAVGVGAGTKDPPERANVTRVLIGTPAAAPSGPDPGSPDAEVLLELAANVDDLDPRLWPGVLDRLLAAGALDAWLVPVVMKKGRPAHVLQALCRPEAGFAVREQFFAATSTLGVRESAVTRYALRRDWRDVRVDDLDVAVKVGHHAGRVVQAMPEFDGVARVAAATGRPEREVLSAAQAAATQAGLVPGASWPSR